MSDTDKPEVASLSFEQAMDELERIVRGLEQGDIDLEESIAAYERGTALRKHCEEKLAAAQARIDKISIGADGRPGVEPADIG